MNNYKGNVSYSGELVENKLYKRFVKKKMNRSNREMKKYSKLLKGYRGNVSCLDKLELNEMYPNIYRKVGE